jgi:hypothetical protein
VRAHAAAVLERRPRVVRPVRVRARELPARELVHDLVRFLPAVGPRRAAGAGRARTPGSDEIRLVDGVCGR